MTLDKRHSDAGSVIGAGLLITGSCVGAGMLALPILAGLSGFFPAMVMFFIAWIFMTIAALYIIEVNGWYDRPVNFITMSGYTLGVVGKVFCWVLYLCLFYALIVAYISASGNHTADFFAKTLSVHFPDWVGSIFFILIFGWLVYLGTRPVDLMNRWLMLGKILAYLGLVILGLRFVTPKLYEYTHVSYAFFALPALIISFGFHNVIPSVTTYLGGDIARVKKAIYFGSILTLCIYIFWVSLTVGILPVQGKMGIIASFKNDIDAAQALRNYLGLSTVGLFAQVFAFFAILTSFLAQSLCLVHFLRDGLKIQRHKRENIWLCICTFFPPLVLALIFPQIFFFAINFAGGVCAVALFGILPVLMIWKGRYLQKIESSYNVRGGKPLLIAQFLIASFIMFYQISIMLGFDLFPHP